MSDAGADPNAIFVILTSKAGSFYTEPGPDLQAVETYDYLFFGVRKTRFVIAALCRATKIVIVDEGDPPTVNRIPSKLLPKYDSLAAARSELAHLVPAGNPNIALVRVAD